MIPLKDESHTPTECQKKFIFDEFNSDNSKGEFIDKHWLKKRLLISLIDPLMMQLLTKYFLFLSLKLFIKMSKS
jgi:hypothetical protein